MQLVVRNVMTLRAWEVRMLPQSSTIEPLSRPRAVVHELDYMAFLRSLPAESVDLVITDPPYGEMSARLKMGKSRSVPDEGSGWWPTINFTPENFHPLLAEFHRVLKADRHIFIMFDPTTLLSVGRIVGDHFKLKNLLTWDKMDMGMGGQEGSPGYRRQTEFIIVATKGRRSLSRYNFRDLLRVKGIRNARYRTQKPVQLIDQLIDASMHPGDVDFVIVDPFSGSGSTAIAALKRGATFVGADIVGSAVTFATRRIEGFLRTGIDLGERTLKQRIRDVEARLEGLHTPLQRYLQAESPTPSPSLGCTKAEAALAMMLIVEDFDLDKIATNILEESRSLVDKMTKRVSVSTALERWSQLRRLPVGGVV